MSPNSETGARLSEPASEPAGMAAGLPQSAEAAVVLPVDLHARPAGRLAQAAARFRASVEIEFGGRVINPVGVLSIMSLGATGGTTVVVRAVGDDAAEAVRALGHILVTVD